LNQELLFKIPLLLDNRKEQKLQHLIMFKMKVAPFIVFIATQELQARKNKVKPTTKQVWSQATRAFVVLAFKGSHCKM